jgi:hypothetical protein
MEQNRIFDIIINLLMGIKNRNQLVDKCGDEDLVLNGCSYLLNQTIRQYQFSKNHYFVSKKAQELWDKISTDSIFNYTYRDTVTKNIDEEVEIEKFRGGEGTPYATTIISRGDKFIYKDVFTDEHIVTVSDIIEELLNLPEYDYASIKNILDKIYICKMLKSEDRAIENKKKRSLDYREVVVFDYKKAGIELTTFDYISNLKNMINEYEIDLGELGLTEEAVPKNEIYDNTQSESIEKDEEDFLFEVIHDTRGEGKAIALIRKEEDYYIRIAFNDTIEDFVYPDQFFFHLKAKDPEIQKGIKSEYAAFHDRINSRTQSYCLTKGFLAGTNAQYIYDKYCGLFGWESMYRGRFAQRQKLYSSRSTPEGYAVWMPVHTNLCEEYNKEHVWFNFVLGDKIKEVWFDEDYELLNDKSTRVCFARTKRGYEFQGIYVPEETRREEIKGKLELVRTFRRISTKYPLER